jgi:hypothetical protein
MTPSDYIATLRSNAIELLAAVKQGQDSISLHEAKGLASQLREIEGWLLSSRRILEEDPEAPTSDAYGEVIHD